METEFIPTRLSRERRIEERRSGAEITKMSGIYGRGERGSPIIENSHCHCILANLKIASDDGGSRRESGTLMNSRSQNGA